MSASFLLSRFIIFLALVTAILFLLKLRKKNTGKPDILLVRFYQAISLILLGGILVFYFFKFDGKRVEDWSGVTYYINMGMFTLLALGMKTLKEFYNFKNAA